MCQVCEEKVLGRRRFLGLAGMGLLAASLSLAGGSAALAAGGAKTTLTADQALAKLKEGNAKFVAGPQLCEADLVNARAHVSKGQAPWATIVGCADSRVPPELVFGGLNVGEIFIARNAGNMVDTATMGTIEYGSSKLRCCCSSLRCRDQKGHLSWFDRPDGEGNHSGCESCEKPTRRSG